jgi:hypothetical protein
LGPTVIDASSGLDFTAGNSLQIDYVSGLTSAFGGTPVVDAVGYTNFIFNNFPGNSNQVAPSAFIPSTEYDVYLNELVGTFADATGSIVGNPFAIGLARNVIIPVGASRLQLGVNDDIYADNTGALTVNITGLQATRGTQVPEPFTVIGTLIGGTAVFRMKKKLKSTANT